MLNLVGKRVFLACGRTDMRKSIDGLTAIVEGSFKLDPFDGALFVFCNRKCDRCKILEWDIECFNFYLAEEGIDKADGLTDAAHKKLIKRQFAEFESAMHDGMY